MSYRVVLSTGARRALAEELPDAVAAACWEFIRGPLAADPRRVGKPLRGELQGRYSARRGEFRIIYDIVEQQILIRVIAIRHRLDVYR